MNAARRALLPALLLLALLIGAALRLQRLDWDAGQHLHPDERFITMRALELRLDWPLDWQRLLDPQASPLNPRFFAYGSLTLYVLRAAGHVGAWWQPFLNSYDGLTLVGRALSALFDVGSIALVFALGARLAGRWVGLLAAWLVALTPFHVQVAHFWAADTPLTFFVLLALHAALSLARGGGWLPALGFGAALGVALGFKIAAAPLALLAVVAPALAALAVRQGDHVVGWRPLDAAALRRVAAPALLALGATTAVFVATQPYALLDAPTFLRHLGEQGAMARGTADLPYTRQYVGTLPYVYYLQQLVLWGFGPALGIAALAGWAYASARGLRHPCLGDLVLLAWVLPYFAIVGSFHAKFMRYMLPLTPILALWAAWLLRDVAAALGRRWPAGRAALPLALAALVVAPTALAALAFSAIYTRPPTRVAASAWLYQNVPPGATLTAEHWDDPLPLALALDGQPRSPRVYRILSMDLYDPDDARKMDHVVGNLLAADYVVLSSNRLYGSIPRSPERYPLTTRYYRLLFEGALGFTPVAVFSSYPTLLGWEIVDDGADESFTVYDHPKVLIFKKTTPLSRVELTARLAPGLATAGPPPLTLAPDELAAQRAGGTFAEIFPADGLGNRAPLLVWLALVVLLGLLALPLATLTFARLPDLGYGVCRPLGLLAFAWLYWLGVSIGLLPGTRAGTLAALAVLATLGLAAAWCQRRALAALWRERRAALAVSEAAFWLAFAVFLAQRLANPDLWHPVHGGEKPMDLAYLTAVVKSSVFPPYDPWFAGGYLNYYYFGQVILGALLKLSGIVPAVAYNLAVPTIAGYAASAAASLGLALAWREFTSPPVPLSARGEGERGGEVSTAVPEAPRTAQATAGQPQRSAYLAGGAAAFLLLGIGNLGGAAQLWQTLWEVGGQPVRSALPGLAGLLNGLWGLLLVLTGTRPFPPLPLDWYWASTRIIKDTINEFPFFTFLYGDLHAHVIALPLFLSVAALALNAALARSALPHPKGGSRRGRSPLRTPSFSSLGGASRRIDQSPAEHSPAEQSGPIPHRDGDRDARLRQTLHSPLAASGSFASPLAARREMTDSPEVGATVVRSPDRDLLTPSVAAAADKAPLPESAGWRNLAGLPLGALLLGALWTTNAWDYPTGAALLLLGALVGWWSGPRAPLDLLARLAHLGALVALSVVLYRPFHARFVSFYGGVVPHGERSDVPGYLAIYGLFLFLLLSLAAATLATRYRQTAWLRALALGLRHWWRLPR
ncbi:MAG: glycosyltransferase family 39 protein, partial [Chloroflexi bacterium]|nr:glycosyltransferase family 39 protein [Chloroflexota bacterium]